MMTEEQKNELAGLCRIEIRRWKHAAEAVPDKRYMVELMELALAALTQPASPALRLPDEFSPHDAKMFCADHGVTGAYELASQMANYAVDKVKRLNAPHTAPIEPICATGGWQDPLLHPAIIALKNGEIHAPEVLDIFDAMAREIQVHRDYKRWDYAPKCSTGGAEWVKCSERMPHSEPGMWSKEVAAVSELGDVFKLSAMGGYWQRSKAFIESGAKEITYWYPLPEDT